MAGRRTREVIQREREAKVEKPESRVTVFEVTRDFDCPGLGRDFRKGEHIEAVNGTPEGDRIRQIMRLFRKGNLADKGPGDWVRKVEE